MSIIIQTGHSSSYSDKLMHMLYERGLGEPFKSHTHQLSANEITERLAKVLTKSNTIINTKIMDNLMVDLLLANLDQDDWGWADERNIDTLNYWQLADENSRFILVFDSPKLLLKSILGQNITTELIESTIQDWLAYHEKMLAFFENNADYCLLVEGDLAVNNLMNVKDQIQAITTNLKLKNNWQLSTIHSKHGEQIPKANPMFDIIANEILKQYPECMALYKTLIKKSSIRLKNRQLPAKSDLSALIQSLNLVSEQETLHNQLLNENEYLQTQLLALTNEKQALAQQLNHNILLLGQSQTASNSEQQAKQAQIEQENKSLTMKLQQLQADMQKLEQSQKASATAKQENELLITQLHQVQEELERYYLENQKLKSQKQEPAKPVYYGAADRVKEDLPYRLGAAMVSHSKSAKDLAVLPLALAKEYREFQKNQPTGDLPAIEEYQDADEAEKVKKHLSYRLGKTLVDGVKSKKVLDLPVKLGREIVGFGKK